MAVDTATKRFAMMNSGWVPTIPGIVPSGSVDAIDRAHLLNLYGGNAFDAPTIPEVEIEVPREAVFGGGAAYPSRNDYKKKRKEQAILDDDEELISIIQAAMPTILKYLNK